MKFNTYAAFGDPGLVSKIVNALRERGLDVIKGSSDLAIQDEWQVRQWFADNQPDYVFVCVGNAANRSIRDFTFTVVGSCNVLAAAAGLTLKVRVVSEWPTAELHLLGRLTELYWFTKAQDYVTLLPRRPNDPQFVADCVLHMQNVSAKETLAQSSNGPHQGGKVRNALVSESQGTEVGRLSPGPLLEMPVSHGQGAHAAVVCAERDPSARQGA